MISNLHKAKHLDGRPVREDDIKVGLVVNISCDNEMKKCECVVNDAFEIKFDTLEDWPTTFVMKKNIPDLTLEDFRQLSDALKNTVIPGGKPTREQEDIIIHACQLGYARNNANSKPGWSDKGIARFSNLMIEDDLKGTFQCVDGYQLLLKIGLDNKVRWSDGDLTFDTNIDGFPIDDEGNLLQGNLIVYLPLELDIEKDIFNVTVLFNLYVDDDGEIASPLLEIHFQDDMIEQDISSLIQIEELEQDITHRFINKGSKSGSTTLVSKDKDDVVKSVNYKIKEPNIELGFLRHDLNEFGHAPTM